MPAIAARPKLHALVARLGTVKAIDPAAKAAGKAVRTAVPKGAVKDALSGTQLGHALHPILTDVVVGTWLSATMLDVAGGRDARAGADRLIAVGIAAALPTAASGTTDWADTEVADDEVRRVGAVHALLNVAALGLYSGSLAARRNDRRGLGVALGLAGAGVLAVSGDLGGHLSFAKAVGVDQTAWGVRVDDWADACADGDVQEGRLAHAVVDGAAVLLVRRGGRVHALADRCSHRGGALHTGELVDGCVQCPLHGSRFSLEDGSVERGPSAYPQPVYEVRVRDGRVEVRTPPGASEG